MGTVCHGAGRITPGSAGRGHHAVEKFRTVKDIDCAVRNGTAAQRQRAVVGDVITCNTAVGREQGNGRGDDPRWRRVDRSRIVLKAIWGDHGPCNHVDVTETLYRAVIGAARDALPDVIVYAAVAEAARVYVIVGDSECAVDEVGREPHCVTGRTHRRRGNNYSVVRYAAAIECGQRGVGVTIQGKPL